MAPVGIELIGPLIMALVALILGAIAAGFAWAGLRGLADVRGSARWRAVPARVMESGTVQTYGTTTDGHRTMTHRPVVRYEYEVDGVRYESDRLQFGRAVSFGSQRMAAARVAGFSPGTAVTAYVDPNDPTSAVLQRASLGGWLFLGVSGVLGVVALGLLIGGALMLFA